MADKVHPDFEPLRGDPGVSLQIALAFSELQEKLSKLLCVSRERNIVTMKLQEAHLFAQCAPALQNEPIND